MSEARVATFDLEVAPPFDRHALRVTVDQVEEVFVAIHDAIDDLEHGVIDRGAKAKNGKPLRSSATVYSLIDEVKIRRNSRDGFGAGGLGGGSRSATDDDGNLLLDYGDRTGNAVMARLDTDVPAVLGKVVRSAVKALNELHVAIDALMAAEPKSKMPPVPSCRSCARLSYFNVEYAVERCRWCWDWFHDTGADPHIRVLQAHLEGRRITDKFLERIEAEERIELGRKKRKGKRSKKRGGRR